MSRTSVLLTTEGTYPFVGGGVSTWCDLLCSELEEIDFSIMALTGSPLAEVRYTLPANIKHLVQVPLWGMAEPAEHVDPEIGLLGIAMRRSATSEDMIEAHFVPLLETLLDGLATEPTDPLDVTAIGDALDRMSTWFIDHDWGTTWKSRAAWEAFCGSAQRARYGGVEPTVWELTTGLRWLHFFLMPLAVPLPRTTIVHATIAAFAALPGIVAKARWGTPFLLTEHGVAVRERYIAVASQEMAPWAGRFLVALSSVIARVAYAHADVISPVADYNRRWELRHGAEPDRIRTIYNGVDPAVFKPRPRPAGDGGRPTVVAAARVFPLKDVETMIRAAAVTREQVPNVRYLVYGSLDADIPYVERCRALVTELGLEDTFELAGLHDSPADLFCEGDISILSSISEGFPYTVLESMACGRPVVATDVGGVREALDGFGIVVPPRDPVALGEGAARLLLDHQLRSELGRRSREEVLARYRIEHSISAYRFLYEELSFEAELKAAADFDDDGDGDGSPGGRGPSAGGAALAGGVAA